MKLICTQENLSRALSALERVVGKQTTLPILSNILLETEKGRLKISATNLEIGVITSIGAKIEQEGRIAVPAKVLSGFTHNLPAGEVLELQTNNQTLELSSATYQIKIKGLDGKDFPIIPQYKKEYPFVLPAQEVKNALQRLLFCVSLNEARIELTGVNVLFFENGIHLAATDSFRLAEEVISFSARGEGYKVFLTHNQSLIIPANTFQEILRIIRPETEGIKIALEENQIFFEIDGVQVISRVINGKYPDYKQIIPTSFGLEAQFHKEAFQRALKIAGTFSSYASGEIYMHFSPTEKQCVIQSASQEVGENKTVLSLPALTGTGELNITFNPRYLLDGINAIAGDTIVFLANTSTTPVALKPEKQETEKSEYLYIVMPIRK